MLTAIDKPSRRVLLAALAGLLLLLRRGSGEFVGCFVNKGDCDRVDGHVADTTFAECGGQQIAVLEAQAEDLLSTLTTFSWFMFDTIVKQLAAQGVTANVISPGPINGDYEDARTLDGIKATVAQVPANRMGEPSEIAALVKLLVSDEGSYINAQMLQINGGAQT